MLLCPCAYSNPSVHPSVRPSICSTMEQMCIYLQTKVHCQNEHNGTCSCVQRRQENQSRHLSFVSLHSIGSWNFLRFRGLGWMGMEDDRSMEVFHTFDFHSSWLTDTTGNIGLKDELWSLEERYGKILICLIVTSSYLFCHVIHLFSAPDIIQDTDGRLDRHNDKIDGFALAAWTDWTGQSGRNRNSRVQTDLNRPCDGPDRTLRHGQLAAKD